MGLEEVGVHPFQLGHFAHSPHQSLCYDMQRVEVFAVETVFQFGHFQVVETLEPHVSLWESFAPDGLIFRQQLQCLLVGSGVHDELRVVLACHLGGIAHHEARR